MREQAIHEASGRRGTIVNIGSQESEFPIPTSTAYGASKQSLIYLTETAAVNLAPIAVSVNVVLPGMVYERMWKSVNEARSRMRGEDFAERVERDLIKTPTSRSQAPDDLAGIVLFATTSSGLDVSGKTKWSEAHVS